MNTINDHSNSGFMSFHRQNAFYRFFYSVLPFLLIASLGSSCQNKPSSDEADTTVTESVGTNSNLAKDFRLVAGQSAGDFRLGQEVEESGLFDHFGPADSVDTETCKSWSMWFPEETQEVAVYAACDSALDMKKSIQLIRLAGIAFISDKELTEKSNVQQLKRLYPEALEEEYADPMGAELTLYDAVESGIAFEVSDDHIRSVIIHAPGKKLSDYYLPFLSSPAP